MHYCILLYWPDCSLLGSIGSALYESSGRSLHRPMHTNGRKTVVVVELPFNAQIVSFHDCSCVVSGWSLPLLSPNNWRMHLRKLCCKYFTLSCDVMQRCKIWVILLCKFCTSAGDITQKGYDKKRLKLLTPYLATQKLTGSCINVLLNKIYTDVMLLCKLQLYTAALPCRSW